MYKKVVVNVYIDNDIVIIIAIIIIWIQMGPRVLVGAGGGVGAITRPIRSTRLFSSWRGVSGG